ncbi:protein starmaker [Trifolium pratense]|nr:protein starmaker [Trifolium pratense]
MRHFRPKKAPVPNWLREEIKKTVIAAPSADHPKGEQTLVRDGIDKSYVKADDETDSKSIDSSRSAEDEEDEEVEVDRTAAINQEIRKILTDVLLKVTDELFDEIATKVLSEDDLPAEVGHNVDTSNHKASTSPPYALVAKATAKVLVPVKAKEIENDGADEKSNSSSPGDVLGLGNYGSDADDEIESSTVPAPAKDDAYMENNIGKTNTSLSRNSNGDAIDQLHDAKMTEESDHSDSSKIVYNGYSSKDMSGVARSELPGKNGVEKATDDHLGNESRRKSEKNDRHDKSSSEKDFKEAKSSHKSRTDEKGDESKRRKDERNQKKERITSDDRKGGEKSHRGRTTEDTSRKKEHSKDKGEHKSRRREAGDHDRHKRRRSSSVSSRGRPSKDHSHADDSSGEGSDGSKRFRTDSIFPSFFMVVI